MKRVLCATDFSEASDEALRQAHEIALGAGAALAVCHVVPDVQRIHPLFPQRHLAEALGAPALEQRARAALIERAEKVTGRGPNEIEIILAIGSGYPEILQHVEEWRADLLVAGGRGHSGLGRLLGSVASHLVRYASCPVLIARTSAARGVVLAATDLSDAALPAIAAAAEEAVRRNASLVVAHAFDFAGSAGFWALGSPFGLATALLPAEIINEVRDAARATLEGALARFGAKGEIAILEGAPAASILREAEARGAELIVVGTRGRTGFARVALGSVAENVVESAACSVLAVRLHAS